jgi:hypothetical protein
MYFGNSIETRCIFVDPIIFPRNLDYFRHFLFRTFRIIDVHEGISRLQLFTCYFGRCHTWPRDVRSMWKSSTLGAIRNWPPYVSTYVSHKISTPEKMKSFRILVLKEIEKHKEYYTSCIQCYYEYSKCRIVPV